ncbi:MAG: glycerate kinase [Thermodesulfovibrionales bacterium]
MCDVKVKTKEIFYSALKAVDPYNAVRLYTDKIRSIYQDGNFNRLIVIAFGKAACPMAKAVEEELGDLIDTGIVITKNGGEEMKRSIGERVMIKKHYPLHPFTTSPIHQNLSLHLFTLFNASHPVPDENGLKATEEVIKLIKEADEKTLVICLISGGGSALLVAPYEGITLAEKQLITELLLKAGADIYELNTVRKHISRVKGGRLAEIAYPAMVISLILSDVIGDRLDVIASGPTAPDRSTFRDALSVLEKYRLIDKAPESIIKFLQAGADGLVKETPKEGDRIFQNVENIIIGSNRIALEAARQKAEELGLRSEIITSELTGEAREVGRWLARRVRNELSVMGNKRICFISGGETTVTVKSNGKGGRNTELALAFAMEIEGIEGITLLSAGTDGTDGPTDAAGAIVNGETVKKARAIGLNPEEYLNNNDSYNFFKKIDGLFITGPTGTNVMDVQIVIMEK